MSRFVPVFTRLAPLAFLACCTSALFAVACTKFFAIDDFWWLYDGRFVMATWHGWYNAFFQNNGAGPYRPLTQNVFFWAGWHSFGFHPLGYHVACIAALAATSVALYLSLKNMLGSGSAALVGASLFAFSVTHYEGISWVSAFSETGGALPFVLAVYFFVKRKATAAVLCYILALLCNETTTPLPLILLAVAILVERNSMLAAFQRTAGFWACLAGYCYFRLRVTGLPVSHSGAFAIHTEPRLYLNLIVQSVADSFGFVPAYGNLTSGSGHWAVAAVAPMALLGICVLLFAGVTLKERMHSRVLSIAAAGAIWFLAALFPLLLFSANDWSFYNLEIPLAGLALAIGGLFVVPFRFGRYVRATAAVSILAVAAVTVYAPVGLNRVSGLNPISDATEHLYAYLGSQLDAGKQTVNIVAPADMALAQNVAGSDYGLALLTGSPNRRILFSTAPLHADVTLYWNPQGRYFSLVPGGQDLLSLGTSYAKRV